MGTPVVALWAWSGEKDGVVSSLSLETEAPRLSFEAPPRAERVHGLVLRVSLDRALVRRCGC